MVVINKIKIFFFTIFFLLISIKCYSNIILDYETEEFIKEINKQILSVNKFNNKINFKIIYDRNINAYVNQNNTIYISSGLIEKSPSYVSLLGVIAHEIGHIEKFHINKKIESIENLKFLNILGNISILAGSIISNNPEIIQTIAANEIGINNFYINFSKEQEREADNYAIDTLNKLNLPSSPLIELINIIEKESLKKGITEEHSKFSTHPIYSERYDIIEKNKKNNVGLINMNTENNFYFIKAKFLGYSLNNLSKLEQYLPSQYQDYTKSIYYSKNGELKKSLVLLNSLIEKNKDNYYLLETKADILLSHGYSEEAINFYKVVLKKYPKNKYIQIKIFNNTNTKNLSKSKKINLFNNNLNLLFKFPNYKILYLKYKYLSEDLNLINWVQFFEIYDQKFILKREEFIKKLKYISTNSNDKMLNKIIKLHIK